MSADDRDFTEWSRQWQAGVPQEAATAEQIRHYVKRRGGLLWSLAVADFVIGGIALPLLAYFAWMAEADVERFAMMGLASITIATIGFGWWNWRGVLRSSATSVAEYVAISAERLRRLRLAWRIAWIVLTGEVVLFAIWIWDLLYSGARPHSEAAERFAWGWLGGFTAVAVISLIAFGRWISRDAARFDALRRELSDRS